MNPVFDFINTLCNFTVLNLVFLITCLPVVTIGAALSSLYYVTLREARGEYGYLVRTYLKEFKSNLKSGTGAFLLLFAVGAAILFGLSFWYFLGTTFSAVVLGLLFIGSLLWLFTFSYTFPLIGRFENTVKQTLKNAFSIAMCNMKSTLLLLLTDALFLFFCLYFAPMKLLMVLFGFAFLAYCQSFILNKVFEPYEKEQLEDTNAEIIAEMR